MEYDRVYFQFIFSVINQIQNSKLSTYNLESLSKLFSQTETDVIFEAIQLFSFLFPSISAS